MTRRLARRLVLPVAALAAAACSASEAPPADPPATWHGSARALLERHCTSCHRPGGVGPFSLADYESAQTFAGISIGAVEAGRMPPWPPSTDCRSYLGERVVPPDDVALLRAWVDAGTPEGDPADYVAPVLPPTAEERLGPPTLELLPTGGAYTSPPWLTDDYHCFLLDHAFSEDAWIQMLDVLPGNDATVHHVIVYRVPPHDVPLVESLDAAEPGEGYTCFGGPGGATPQNLGGWLPGIVAEPFPDGVALPVPAGSRLVVQVHYNLLTAPGPDPGTAVRLWLSPGPPTYLVDVLPLADLSIVVDPGDAASEHVQDFYNTSDDPWVVFAVSAHMHLLGSAFSMTSVRTDGTEQCLLDIPKWDFGWQQPYAFDPGTLVVVEPGERVRMRCVYDNSEANQPYLGPEVSHEPRTVHWGDGTLDEMCLGFLILLRPHDADAAPADPGAGCGGFDLCYATCRDAGGSLSGCTFACPEATATACGPCALTALYECLAPICPTPLGDVLGCLQDCHAPGVDTDTCLASGCSDAWAALDACAEPLADGGECETAAAACGISLETDAQDSP